VHLPLEAEATGDRKRRLRTTIKYVLVSLKAQVRDFWNEASCGEVYADGTSRREQLEAQARTRYQLEPYIESFARFDEGRGRAVLEIGVGMGADHVRWAQARPRLLVGMDLTPRAVDHTRFRSSDAGFTPRLLVADSELLPFASASFDLVYSWGVIHHTPDTWAAVREIHRVLKPGGVARVMIYHSRSITAALLWARYALARGALRRSVRDVLAHHLESPGTKAYTVGEARALFAAFSRVDARSILTFTDLLEGEAGQRHRGPLLATARALWPRPLIRRLFPRAGLDLLIEAVR
jgi:SAM-dependent methyltransferase